MAEQELLAASKGVHREVESEGSLMQSLGLTNSEKSAGVIVPAVVEKDWTVIVFETEKGG